MNKPTIPVLFRSFVIRASSRIRGRCMASRSTSTINISDDIEDDADDLDKYEGDFMNLDKTHDVYETQENLRKRMLARRITKYNYLKNESEPNFLTHVEKIQVRALHKMDPEEWTIQKLSNSFPALPHVIEKLVKSHWQPTSVARVVHSDYKVKENWAALRAGKLAVSHELKMHLVKFMDRRISSVGRDTLAAQFVRPQLEMPETKNRSFQKLGEAILKNNEPTESKTELLENKDVQKMLTSQVSVVEKITRVAQSNKADKKLMKFDEFIEQKMDKLDAESVFSKKKLLAAFEKCVQESITDKNMPEHSIISVNSKSTELTQTPTCHVSSMPDSIDCNFENTITSKQNSSSTFIIKRNLNVAEEEHVTISIKIPKSLYQKGMTYKINNCYYDDDGEFLFRVI